MKLKSPSVLIFAPIIVGLSVGQGVCAGQDWNRNATSTTRDTRPPSTNSQYVLRGPSRLPFRNTLTGDALLSGPEVVVQSGNPLLLRVQFQCDGGFTHVYDPFFCSADPQRATLRVFDAEGKYVGNALLEIIYDERGQGRWLYMQSGTTTGRIVQVETGDYMGFTSDTKASARDDVTVKRLGIGKYSLQFVMMGRYIDTRNESDDRPMLRPSIRETQEICHSNVLEVEVRRLNDAPDDRAKSGDSKVKQAPRSTAALQDSVEGQREPPFAATLLEWNRN